EKAEKAAPSAGAGAPASPNPAEVRVSPAAQRVAAEKGVDVSSIKGTGRGGVVSKPDVIEHETHPVVEFVRPAAEQPSAPAGAPKPTAPAAQNGRETR